MPPQLTNERRAMFGVAHGELPPLNVLSLPIYMVKVVSSLADRKDRIMTVSTLIVAPKSRSIMSTEINDTLDCSCMVPRGLVTESTAFAKEEPPRKLALPIVPTAVAAWFGASEETRLS